mmetsp:Transcript_15175/g.18261  ORF Transcript_15175/g.18261 Transcript_15175/m.18261 type:complete len:174 (-) Transcript_15175:64-585(-)
MLSRFSIAARLTYKRPISSLTRNHLVRCFSTQMASESITYSGGQATEGQGGFYGSGGARHITPTEHAVRQEKMQDRRELLAVATDVQNVEHVMTEVDRLGSILEIEEAEHTDEKHPVSGKSIEIKSAIKHLMTSHDFMESLNRLECSDGEPIWGLSVEERELVMEARSKVNGC